jgi:hypothetical protein
MRSTVYAQCDEGDDAGKLNEHVGSSSFNGMAKQQGAGKGGRVRDAITGRFLKKGTEKRRPKGTVVERLKSRSGRKK